MNKHLRFWLTLIALLSVLQGSFAAVGLVLDLNGSVKADVSGRAKVLDIAGSIEPGTRIDLNKGGEICFVFYPTRQQFAVVGPASLQITEGSVKQLQGNPMRPKNLAENRTAVAMGFQDRVVPAAMVMRSLLVRPRTLEPQDGETVLSERPEFAWKTESGGLMEFSLSLDGALVHQQQTDGNRLELPAGLSLASGREYRWQVAFANGDRAGTNWGTFTVANASLRQQALSNQPPAEAELAEWVLYAMTLDQLKLRTDANRVWARISDQRPASSKLKEMLR